MAQQWAQNVQAAFHGDPVLAKRIVDAGYRYQNELPSVFDDIAQHILSAQSTTTLPTNTKKRKIDDGSQANGTTAATALSNAAITFECKNVSFQAPARKKLKLDLARDGQDPRRQEIRLIDQKTEQREHTLSTEQIDQIFCLPLPEKQQRQWNFCVLPQAGATTSEGLPCEQLVFTLNETKPDDAHSATRPAAEGDTYVTVAEHELNQLLQPLGKRVVKPDEAEFASSIPQSHRKGEKAYHVKAHRGTKEGYLFFLPNGIVFGFKKPLSFFPFSAIESISYTSVLQRTFNLVIAATEGTSPDIKEVEFSMLDQADFAGIDEYVKRRGLNDASMHADRKAKAYNVNKSKTETNGEAGLTQAGNGADEQTELAKAEQQLQDEEDEEEEDYEASGGESDGEGEDSDEEEGDGEGYEEEVEEDEEVE